MQNYLGPIKGLGGWAIVSLVFGLLFKPVILKLLPAQSQGSVIIHALPFVAYFVAILLVFILGIVLLGKRLHLNVPNRTHRAVEYTIIASIIIGILALFQSWNLGPYNYGFSLLLFSTLAFIVWSHVAPRSVKDDVVLPKHPQRATLLASILGLIIAATIAISFATATVPKEPYGLRQRQWNTMRDEQKQDVMVKAKASYVQAYIPFFIVYGILTGLVVFFLVREAATPRLHSQTEGGVA
jgi:hypothetical protein